MAKRLLSILATQDIAIITQKKQGNHIWQEVLELKTNQVGLRKIIKTVPTIGQDEYYGVKKNNIQGPIPNKNNVLI